MAMSLLQTQLWAILADELGLTDEQLLLITPESRLIDLGADSLQLIALAQAIEESWEIEIADEEWEKAVTVGLVEALIEEKVSASAKEKTNVKQS